jgi:hypothetical protein
MYIHAACAKEVPKPLLPMTINVTARTFIAPHVLLPRSIRKFDAADIHLGIYVTSHLASQAYIAFVICERLAFGGTRYTPTLAPKC